MKIKCFRCPTVIDTPDKHNAYYVRADDMIVDELRDVYTAVKDNEYTLETRLKMVEVDAEGLPKYPELVIKDSDYTRIHYSSFNDVHGDRLVRVEVTKEPTPVQKTGVVCPECHLETDTVIWGVEPE